MPGSSVYSGYPNGILLWNRFIVMGQSNILLSVSKAGKCVLVSGVNLSILSLWGADFWFAVCCYVNHPDQKQPVGKRFISTCISRSQPSLREVRQELKQRPWCSSVSSVTQCHLLRSGTASCQVPHQSKSKTALHRHTTGCVNLVILIGKFACYKNVRPRTS